MTTYAKIRKVSMPPENNPLAKAVPRYFVEYREIGHQVPIRESNCDPMKHFDHAHQALDWATNTMGYTVVMDWAEAMRMEGVYADRTPMSMVYRVHKSKQTTAQKSKHFQMDSIQYTPEELKEYAAKQAAERVSSGDTDRWL